MLQPDPLAFKDSLSKVEIFKSNGDAIHGDVVKNKKIGNTRQKHKVKILLFIEIV
jgi:hypothetical protein